MLPECCWGVAGRGRSAEQAEEKLTVLKGHDFSRAETAAVRKSALAAEGI